MPDAWIHLSDGTAFDYLNPRAVPIEVLARSLSRIARFAGHTREFYSVAQHSVLVSALLPREIALYGLLHDAAEAVTCDIPSPLKSLLNEKSAGFLTDLENAIDSAILRGFGLEPGRWHAEVKRADGLALCVEVRDLIRPSERAIELPHGLVVVLDIPPISRCWLPAEAEERFLERGRALQRPALVEVDIHEINLAVPVHVRKHAKP